MAVRGALEKTLDHMPIFNDNKKEMPLPKVPFFSYHISRGANFSCTQGIQLKHCSRMNN